MPTVVSGSHLEHRVREFAGRLGIEDDRAIAAALHHGHSSESAAYRYACGLLRSWQRHPSNRNR